MKIEFNSIVYFYSCWFFFYFCIQIHEQCLFHECTYFNDLHTHRHTNTDTHVSRYNTGYTGKTLFCVTFVNNYSSTQCTVLLRLLADPENWQKLTDSRWLTDGPWCLALSVRLEWFRYHRQLVFPLFSPVFFLLVEFGWFKWLEVL